MQPSTQVRPHHTAARRDQILAAYRRSGLTAKKFAAQARIGYSTLTLWLRKSASAKASGKARLVPVPNLFAVAPAAAAYRVQFPRGLIVEVTPGFQSGELGTLLELVQKL